MQFLCSFRLLYVRFYIFCDKYHRVDPPATTTHGSSLLLEACQSACLWSKTHSTAGRAVGGIGGVEHVCLAATDDL